MASRAWPIHEHTRISGQGTLSALPVAGGGDDFRAALPFTSLYLPGDEFAAEIANRAVHGVLHVGWVPDGEGTYRGRLAVLVKPNGLPGTGYLAAIRPFRNLIVYPRMMRDMARRWQGGSAQTAASRS